MRKILLLYLVAITLHLHAQTDKAYFKHFTSDDGLPSNYIGTILQDHEGYMWFGTSEGLSRYDGYTFYNLRNSPSDSLSLVHNNVRCLLEDNKHNIWVGTQKGLSYFDLNTYKFKRFSLKFKNQIGSAWITSLCLVDDNHLLVSTFTKGFYIFDIKNEKIIGFKHNNKENNSLVNNTIRYVIKDRGNAIWLATDGGLDKFDPVNGVFVHLLAGKSVQQLCLNPKGMVVVSTLGDAEIYTVDPRSCMVIAKEPLPEEFKDKPKNNYFDSFGNRWSGIVDGGLVFKDVKTNSITHWVYNKYTPDGIDSNAPLVIYEDNIGNIWIGTFDGGVNLLERHRKPFMQVKSNFTGNGLQSNHVRSIIQDSEGDIWIGTKVGGMLSKFNRKTLDFVHYKPNPSIPNSLNDEFVLSMTEAKPGYLWVGTLYGGLNLFNKRTGKFTAIKHDPNNTNSLMSNSILALFRDDKGIVWVGNSEKGIDLYNPSTGIFTHLISSSSPNSLSDNRIRVVFQDKQKNIWVGTFNGLNLYNPKTKGFRQFLNNVSDSTSISDNNIFSIWQDKKQNLWIGTANGFNLFNYKTNTFTSFDRENGFLANSARGIFDDNSGYLWISTDNGLVRFDPVRKKFRKYTKEDGINSNEFAFYSSCKTKDGEMLFGTDNGFLLFNPENITDNIVTPQVVITDFKLFNQPVTTSVPGSPLKKNISRTREITLTYRQSVMTFEFSALNFTSPEKNQYAYKMDGFDKGWNYIGNKRDATYTNLSAGTYIFRVKASNNDGIWNEIGTSLKITILPPPWKTWWAYFLYVLLIAATFLKLRDLTIKRIHEEKAHELDQMKLKLFMNVSHEFRTPLTLMLNPLEKIGASDNVDEIHSSVQVVRRSSRKLLNLVNQLLDFRKIDLGKSPLRAMPCNIVSYTGKIVDLFKNLALTKGLDLRFESSLTELEIWIDLDKYEKIIDNLLSNAFKFTDPGGRIIVRIDRVHEESNKSYFSRLKDISAPEYAEIRICDTGIGLKQEELRNIFESFYQVDHSRAGTGIGLNYAKSLVELHGGDISVESEYGKGSTFLVKIPIGSRHLKPEQMITQISESANWDKNFDTTTVESLQYDIENMDFVAEADEENERGEIQTEQNKQVILIVEDNKTLRKQIHAELWDKYIIKEAVNGQDGLEKSQKYLPDLIISDIMMPKMDGIEFCKRIKSELNTCHIPVILLTAKSSIENKIEGFETGADEYMPKPFSMKLLEVRVKNLILSRKKLKEKYSSSKTLEPAKEYTTNNLDAAFLEKATQIVLENIENPDFSLPELRDKMGMSRTNLFNKIQSITGQNPSNFVRTIRLKYAAQLLVQNNSSIKDICYKCGFNSPAYFIKTFRELYGQTPKEYAEGSVNSKIP
ncbi:MAG TPA: two-component regulator propeller domain-containing protein [Bacteroidales bacterium]